jgi:hypothetical protein
MRVGIVNAMHNPTTTESWCCGIETPRTTEEPMARKATMMPMANGGGTGRRVVVTLVVLTLVALVLRDPVGAAGTVEQVGEWFGVVVDSLARFGEALAR